MSRKQLVHVRLIGKDMLPYFDIWTGWSLDHLTQIVFSNRFCVDAETRQQTVPKTICLLSRSGKVFFFCPQLAQAAQHSWIGMRGHFARDYSHLTGCLQQADLALFSILRTFRSVHWLRFVAGILFFFFHSGTKSTSVIRIDSQVVNQCSSQALRTLWTRWKPYPGKQKHPAEEFGTDNAQNSTRRESWRRYPNFHAFSADEGKKEAVCTRYVVSLVKDWPWSGVDFGANTCSERWMPSNGPDLRPPADCILDAISRNDLS